ncbi:MAG TPA: G5 domain-containing protein [Actinoplanes sp.]|nr:G5 domain-containing protein [Actinoplanes sp.]
MTAGASALLIVIGGAALAAAALIKDSPDAPQVVTAVGDAAAQAPMAGPADVPPRAKAKIGFDPGTTPPRTPDKVDRTATPKPIPPAKAPLAAVSPTPVKRAPTTAASTTAASTTAASTTAASTTAAPTTAAPTTDAPTTDAPSADVPKVAAPKVVFPKAAPAQKTVAKPVLTTRTTYEKRQTPFKTRQVRDSSLTLGAEKVQSPGVPGEETLRYLVTFTDGRQTGRKLVGTTITRQPQDRVVALGSGHEPESPQTDDCNELLDICVLLGHSDCEQDDRESTRALGAIAMLDNDDDDPLDEVEGLLDEKALEELSQKNCPEK